MSDLASAVAYLPELVEAQVRQYRATGAQVAVRTEDALIASFAVGTADVSTGEPLRTDHLFRIASHSKTFTGTAIMQLVEAGSIRLDDPIGVHVEELAGAAIGAATVRELLEHQSGIQRDGTEADFWQLERPFPDRDGLIAEILAHGTIAARNEYFRYSNVGYSLLGLAIESASGMRYADYCRMHIVEPLGLTRTGAEYDAERADEYAAGHTGLLLGENERLTIEHVDTRAMASATGFYSTAEDLTVYGAAHWLGSDALLSDDSKRIMQRTASVVRRYGTEIGRYGVGIEVAKIRDRALVGHSGGYPGHITRTYIDPVGKLVVSVLTNAVDGPAEQIAQAVFAVIDAAQRPLPGAEKRPATDGHAPASFTGRYASLWGLVDVVELGGRLVLAYPGARDVYESMEELEIVDADTLRTFLQPSFGASGEPVSFTRNGDGTVASIRVNGMTQWPLDDFLARRESMTRILKEPAT
ncbi:serine hydrolase domain-containing protein [Microbacterium oxydans]|uniref:Penicillin-binding protein 4 n=1 Tax=Microbacterium oxydans TaxID=82380 RepID=A0A0F0LAN0_9MICO|nr:serine hydrolase domain-containing protein [Microbacterium oxydans]KJL28641.1 Penicillin-binding protein 4* [Microbacterium oxydans]